MAAKVTLKSLQKEVTGFEELIKDIKEELHDVRKELKDTKEELKELKADKIEKELDNSELISDTNFKCKECDTSFLTGKDLKIHVKKYHAKKVKCRTCEEIFEKNAELEQHIRENHEENVKYKCDKCEKSFVLRWRLKKHREGHDMISKTCHYYNNKHICPFEIIGCMFDHRFAGQCKYGSKCTKKMCAFEHNKEEIDEEKELKESFDKLSDDEQFEAKMVVCDVFCKADIGYHRCEDEEFEEFIGLEAYNVTEEYDSESRKTQNLPCEQCYSSFGEYEELKEHFLSNHKREEFIECVVENCDYKTKSVSQLNMHVGISHYELVKIRL